VTTLFLYFLAVGTGELNAHERRGYDCPEQGKARFDSTIVSRRRPFMFVLGSKPTPGVSGPGNLPQAVHRAVVQL